MRHWIRIMAAMGTTLAGCGTTFTGSPHIEGGRGGCEQKCRADGMEVAGMVYMGEYSSACVCAPPGSSARAKRSLVGAAGSVTSGAVGVILQMRRDQQNSTN